MKVFLYANLLLLAASGTWVALCRDPLDQTVLTIYNGQVLVLVFIALQAPDVCLSVVSIGALVTPWVLLSALAKLRKGER
jgi:uncharacterized MnhB-related membrane protein